MTTRLDDIRHTLRDKQAATADAWGGMDPGRRRPAIAGVAIVGVIVLALVAWNLLPSRGPRRLLEDPVAVAKFINSRDFKESPADGRRPYMKAARKLQQQIAEARRSDSIDKQTYRAAYLASWMERRVDDMEEYYAKPAAKRRAYIDEMLGHPAAAGTGTSAKVAAAAQSPPPTAKPKGGANTSLLYDEDDAADEQEFEAMKDRFEDNFLDAWPPQRKEQYKQFRRAYTDRRKQLEVTPAAAGAK